MSKKIISIVLIAVMAISFAACSSKNDSQTETETQKQVQQDIAEKPSDVFCVTYNDTAVFPGIEYSAVSTGLGDPLSTANIDADGAGVSYTFDGMEIDTAYMNDKEVITRVQVLKSTIPTNEGIEVAMPVDMVQNQSSVDFVTQGNTMTYSESNYKIILSFDESGVYSIDISSVNL